MGVSISFISATTEELDRAQKDPSWAEQRVSGRYGVDYPLQDWSSSWTDSRSPTS